jgi:hypothetical protein
MNPKQDMKPHTLLAVSNNLHSHFDLLWSLAMGAWQGFGRLAGVREILIADRIVDLQQQQQQNTNTTIL